MPVKVLHGAMAKYGVLWSIITPDESADGLTGPESTSNITDGIRVGVLVYAMLSASYELSKPVDAYSCDKKIGYHLYISVCEVEKGNAD